MAKRTFRMKKPTRINFTLTKGQNKLKETFELRGGMYLEVNTATNSFRVGSIFNPDITFGVSSLQSDKEAVRFDKNFYTHLENLVLKKNIYEVFGKPRN